MAGKQWGAAGVIALAGIIAVPAFGYILPADAILSGSISRRADLDISTLVFEGTHTVGGQPAPLWGAIEAGRAVRMQTERDGGTKVDLLTKGRRYNFTVGGAVSRPSTPKDDLLLTFVLPRSKDPGAKRSLAFLKRLGVDTEVVSMGRLDGRVAYVIGAKPWETNKPQMWLDKNLRVPLRLITTDGAVVKEQRLTGYGTEVVDQFFPRVIERLENGKVVDRIEIFHLDVNADVDRDLLAPPK